MTATATAQEMDEVQARLTGWVERTVGGRVARMERQPRWRLAFFIDVDRDGETVPLYFRGARGPGDDDLLIREGKLLNLLESEGVPVPHCYGFCPDPAGILLTGLDGTEMFHRESPETQDVLAEEFLTAVARWHAIPAERFEEIGFSRPGSPQQQHLMDLDELEAVYRATVTPDSPPAPLLEFTLRWLRRNVPDRAGPLVLVQGDTGPGQFLFDKGHLTGVIDWELAKLGDPMYDLACMRGRDMSYPFGDFPARLRRYSELSGIPLDHELLRYHSVRTMIITPIAIYPMFASGTVTGVDAVQYLSWDTVYSRSMVQTLAEAVGVELEPVELPAGAETPRSWLFDVLVGALQGEVLPSQRDPMDIYRVNALAQLAGHLRIAERSGPPADEAKIEDAAALLGFRPASVRAADAAVQELALSSGPERDAEFVRYFWHDYARREAMLGPLLGELAETSSLSPVR